jgi:hypothetical protein
MTQVLVLAEGQTEETFLKEVVAPYLHPFGVSLAITVLKTKRVVNAPDFKGGISSYSQLQRDLRLLLANKHSFPVTTMIDFYGLPSESPGIKDMPVGDCYTKVAHVERNIEKDFNDRRLHVYLELHEFEAFAFVDPKLLLQLYPSEEAAIKKLSAVRAAHETPEHINLGAETAPSKRIVKELKRYKKAIDGPSLAVELGVDMLCRSCKHFGEWIAWLKSLELSNAS